MGGGQATHTVSTIPVVSQIVRAITKRREFSIGLRRVGSAAIKLLSDDDGNSVAYIHISNGRRRKQRAGGIVVDSVSRGTADGRSIVDRCNRDHRHAVGHRSRGAIVNRKLERRRNSRCNSYLVQGRGEYNRANRRLRLGGGQATHTVSTIPVVSQIVRAITKRREFSIGLRRVGSAAIKLLSDDDGNGVAYIHINNGRRGEQRAGCIVIDGVSRRVGYRRGIID